MVNGGRVRRQIPITRPALDLRELGARWEMSHRSESSRIRRCEPSGLDKDTGVDERAFHGIELCFPRLHEAMSAIGVGRWQKRDVQR